MASLDQNTVDFLFTVVCPATAAVPTVLITVALLVRIARRIMPYMRM